jgi:hypothetical protein
MDIIENTPRGRDKETRHARGLRPDQTLKYTISSLPSHFCIYAYRAHIDRE